MAKRPPAAKGGRKGGRASAPPPNLSTGDFPSRETVRAFIKDSPGRVGKREIIRHFRLGPDHRTALRDLLRDLASAGNVAPAGHRRFTAPGRLPDAMIVEIIGTDPTACTPAGSTPPNPAAPAIATPSATSKPSSPHSPPVPHW